MKQDLKFLIKKIWLFIDRDDDDESEDVGYGTYDNMEEEEEEAEPMETTPREVNTMDLLLFM